MFKLLFRWYFLVTNLIFNWYSWCQKSSNFKNNWKKTMKQCGQFFYVKL